MNWIYLSACIALAACGADTQASSSDREVDPVSAPTSGDAAVVSPGRQHKKALRPEDGGGAPELAQRDCFLSVDGVVEVKGSCLVFLMGDGGYTLNTWSKGKPRQSHFAVVSINADGSADASWNADPDDDRAGDPLGRVQRVDGCWVNERARICER